MTIGIDGNEANVAKKVGISEYAFELLSHFARMRDKQSTFSIYLKDQPLSEMPVSSEGWDYRILQPRKLWTQWRLPLDLYMHRPRPDIFFTPSHYAPRFSPIPTVVSIMDVSYLRFPELFNQADLYQLKNWTAYSVKQASAVLTISNSSKNDIMSAYHLPEHRVHVTYLGVKAAFQEVSEKTHMQELQKKYRIADEYILFVGTLQPRKNIVRLIEAFSKIKQQKKSALQLVVVGKKGWLYEDILQAPQAYNVEESVVFLDFVPDSDLPLLYQNALCYVLPSLYEGFGLPVLEAMKYDCPVITSNVSSLPEAAGDAALYVDPTDVDDIAKKIDTLIHDKELRHALIEKGKKQVKKFSWEKTAKETLAVLESVANDHRR